MTVGSLVNHGRGLNLFCACGHKTALLPEQLAKLAHPEARLLDVWRRFRCSMCGRTGASGEIRLVPFTVPGQIGGRRPAAERTKH